jgi:hypothetical protein
VADQKKILCVNGPRTLNYNAGITPGATAGVMNTPSDGGLSFSPDYIVQQGVSGFASAARAAGYTREMVCRVSSKTMQPRKPSGEA